MDCSSARQKHFSNGLEFLVNYTWSKSIDDSSVGDDNVTWLGSFTSLQDPNKPWLERSLSTFDIPSVLKFSYSYDLPFGRGKALLGNMPRVLNASYRRMEDQRHLADRGRQASAHHGFERRNTAAHVRRSAAESHGHAETQLWSRLAKQLFCQS